MTLVADKADTYIGKCAELCGPSHGFMEFRVKAVDDATFDKWVAHLKNLLCFLPMRHSPRNSRPTVFLATLWATKAEPWVPNLTGIGSRETIASILLNDISGKPGTKPTKTTWWNG